MEYCPSVRNIKALVSCFLPPQVLLLVNTSFCYNATSEPAEKYRPWCHTRWWSRIDPFLSTFSSPVQSFLTKQASSSTGRNQVNFTAQFNTRLDYFNKQELTARAVSLVCKMVGFAGRSGLSIIREPNGPWLQQERSSMQKAPLK